MAETPNFQPVEALSYNEALTELDSIIRMMQSDRCDIDLLTTYTRRAAELLRACRSRLTTTSEELQTILAALQA
ncbi:MAG: exodeoxyribonuclease VII small subunit [Muribaculaceae bacterium]|nr:exodeoxyribonuclease VII small subunit [Muribaculaceae bacterium]